MARKQTQSAARLTAIVDDVRAAYQLPGAVLAWRANGKTANGKAEVAVGGRCRLGADDPIGREDQWHVGSMTKSMTATLAARLVEAGAISWDDRLGARLGRSAAMAASPYADVTLLQLLSHRSGLPANLPMGQFAAYRLRSDALIDQRRDFVSQGCALPPASAPGSAFLYSNIGYVAAALMLETATGKAWERLIAEQIFAPLRIGSAGFGAPPRIWGHRATGKGAPVPVAPSPFADNPAVMAPAGGVHINARDMLTYLAAHAQRPALLAPASWDRLHRPPAGGSYALGWVVGPSGRLTHNGSNTLWYAEGGFDPATGECAFFATNHGDLPTASKAASRAFLKLR